MRYTAIVASLIVSIGAEPPVPPVQAAQAGLVRIDLSSLQQVQTQPIALSQTQAVRVSLASYMGEPAVSVYVHDADTDVLVSRDDPDSSAGSYNWKPGRQGRYYLVLQNAGSGTAQITVETIDNADTVRSAVEAGHATVRVMFVTNRAKVSAASAEGFGPEWTQAVSYGVGAVSIPREHRMGRLEGPSIVRLEFRDDPDRHVLLKQVETISSQEFAGRVRGQLDTSLRKEVLVFVHGFNVTFEEGMRRAAQLKYDLAFAGPVILFSWPSSGSWLPLAYTRDQRNADLSGDAFRHLLDIVAKPAGTSVHIIAHSMGNRVVTAALQQIAANAQAGQAAKVQELAMFAPDIDAELFRKAARQIRPLARRMTLYASSADGALNISRHVAGYPRAGEAGPALVVMPEIDTIDASSVDTSLLGLYHSYFGDNSSVLSDVYSLLDGSTPSRRQGLEQAGGADNAHWRFRLRAR